MKMILKAPALLIFAVQLGWYLLVARFVPEYPVWKKNAQTDATTHEPRRAKVLWLRTRPLKPAGERRPAKRAA